MVEVLLLFTIGLVLLLFSTQKLVGLSKTISNIFRISPLIVGVTVVAIGTSLPELAITVVSIVQHDAGLALGNVIGSSIVNILLVFPIGLCISKLRIGTTKTQRNALLLLGVTFLFVVIQWLGQMPVLAGTLLIVLAGVVSVMEYKLAVKGRTREDAQSFTPPTTETTTLSMLLKGVLLIVGIVAGSFLVVAAIQKISVLTGISTTILGLTLTAVATSMPELLTTIFSQKDHHDKMTIGTVLGSNIYNLLLIGGIITIFSVSPSLPWLDWVWFIVTTILFVGLIRYYKGKRPPLLVGAFLLVLFGVYLLSQL